MARSPEDGPAPFEIVSSNEAIGTSLRCSLSVFSLSAAAHRRGCAYSQPIHAGWEQRDYNSRMAATGHSSRQREKAEDMRLMVDTIPGLVWSTRPDGSADFFNQRWLEYTGLSAGQALDWGWKDAIHPDDLGVVVVVDAQHAKSRRFVNSRKLIKALTRSSHTGNELHIQLDRAARNLQRCIRWFWAGTILLLRNGSNVMTMKDLQDSRR